MPISPMFTSPGYQAQQQDRSGGTQYDPGLVPNLGVDVANTWHRSWEPVRRAVPLYTPTMVAPKPLAAVGSAACINAVLFAARYAAPGLAIPSLGVHVGVTLAAFTFGWFVIDHQFAALGCLMGAALGVCAVATYGLSSLPLSFIIVALAASFGGALGASCDREVIEAELSSVAWSDDEDEYDTDSVGGDTRAETEDLPAQTQVPARAFTAASINDATVAEEDKRAPFLQRLRRKLERLDCPYAVVLKAKGLRVIQDVKGVQSTENHLGTMGWLKRFETFLETHCQLPPMTPTEIEAFDQTLERSMRGLFGNNDVKRMARRCAASQQRGSGETTYALISGTSGTGKNRFISLMKKVYPVNRSVVLNDMSMEDFAGFPKTYIDSEPSLVTSLLMEGPKSICLLHIDEIDGASPEKQRALLSLLAPENEVVDSYFGLPINKQRLFVICTMKSTDNAQRKLDPDLWNRLKNHVAVLKKPTRSGLQAIAEIALNEYAEKKGMPPILPSDRARAAAELALRCPAGEVGRFVSEEALVVVDHAALLEKMSGVPTRFTPSLVLRALNKTWTSREYEVRDRERQFIPFLGAGKKKRLKCVTLFAVVSPEDTALRWHHDFEDGRVLTVEMSEDKNTQAIVTSADGLPCDAALSFDPRYLPLTPMEANEYVSAEQIQAIEWQSCIEASAGLQLSANGDRPDLTSYSVHFDEGERLYALPLILTDTSVTYRELRRASLSLGYDNDANRRRDELLAQMERLEHFANDW